MFSLWRITLTPDYKCAKISISFSFSRSIFPPCHKCAFLKHTNIIFDCFRLEVVCHSRDFFLLPIFYIDFFLKVRKSFTISGPDTIRNVSYISVQKHSYGYHFIISLHFAK